jgi:hypothetical protein
MEFPAWKIVAGEAAILHELVHVFFPNGNRMLAEGLAIHLQASIGGNPAFPNFGRPLHEVAAQVLGRMTAKAADDASADRSEDQSSRRPPIAAPLIPAKAGNQDGQADTCGSPLLRGRVEIGTDPRNLELATSGQETFAPFDAAVRLDQLDRIATPSGLRLRVGTRVYGIDDSAYTYPLAGSFVAFLIETHGLERFRALYERTPLVPFARDAGAPERWRDVYGVPLDVIEREWKGVVGGERPYVSANNLTSLR